MQSNKKMNNFKILETARKITEESMNYASKKRDLVIQDLHKEDCRLMKLLTCRYYQIITKQIFINAKNGSNHAKLNISRHDLASKYDLGSPKDIAERWIKNLTLNTNKYSNNKYTTDLLGLHDQDMLYGFYLESVVPYQKYICITITWL